MYRCYLCKALVMKREHRDIQGIFGKFNESDVTTPTRDLGDPDFFDEEGYVVICMKCMIDTDIEVENLVLREVAN